MAKEVAKKEPTQVPATLAVVQPAPANEQVLRSDVIIPKLLLMQGLSEFVNNRKAQQGDLVRSTTGEVLGGPDKPVSFIPLTFRNEWTLQEEVKGKYEYRGTEPRNAKNEDAPWTFTHLGANWRRVKVINVFALLPSDIASEAAEIKRFQESGEMPDLNKTLLPVMISFRSTSYNAGKTVATHFAKAQAMAKYGAKPYGYTLKLNCGQESNDKGTFYVLSVEQGSAVSPDQLTKAAEWYQIVSTQAVQVDASDESEAAPAPSEMF